MISATVAIFVLAATEFFLCGLIWLLSIVANKSKNAETTKKIAKFVLVAILLVFILPVWYYYWNPTTLLVVQGDSKITLKHDRYFVLWEIETKDGIRISPSDDLFIYNASKYPLILTRHTYQKYKVGIYDNYRLHVGVGRTVKTPALPDYYFQNAPLNVMSKKKIVEYKWVLNLDD